MEYAWLGGLRRLGGPLPGGVWRLAGRLRPDRDQRPEQRGGQPERGAARAADHGRLSGRPDDPRAAVPVRHGRAGRRRGRVHRDHRRTSPRPARRPRPHPRGRHGHDRAARGAPGRGAGDHRAAARRPRPAGQERPVARRHRPVLPLRRIQLRGLALLGELRVLRSRRGRSVPGRPLGRSGEPDQDQGPGAGEHARRQPVRGGLPGRGPPARGRHPAARPGGPPPGAWRAGRPAYPGRLFLQRARAGPAAG